MSSNTPTSPVHTSGDPLQPKPKLPKRVKTKTRTTTTTRPNNSRLFSISGMRFRFLQPRALDALLDGVQTFFEYIVLLVGPLLILLALAITTMLAYTFFYIMIPMMLEKHKDSPYGMHWLGIHITWVVFLLVNVLFNYFMCVTTRNTGPKYDRVVRELAAVSNFYLPETDAEKNQWRHEYEDKMVLRIRRRREREEEKQQAASASSSKSPLLSENNQNGGVVAMEDVESNNRPETAMTHRKGVSQRSATTTKSPAPKKKAVSPPIRKWMLMGPYEWGYCPNTKQAKPPRSHYDHVTKCLVLNLDHYCPWMFNAIGYFNYRYFVNFLIFVFVGMFYGAIVSLQPFMALQTPEYKKLSAMEREARHHLPRPLPMYPHRDEKMLISLAFMICAAIGFALLVLGGFHVFLVLTAQTTIEFHGNWNKWRRQGNKFRNPYSEGYRKNWRCVYGDRHWFLALLPSTREPEYLPVPIPGQDTRRPNNKDKKTPPQELSESIPGNNV